MLDEKTKNEIYEQAVQKESEGSRLHFEKKVEEAFDAFDEAGRLYRECGEPLKAAVCFASAASCWNIHTGWQPMLKAATRNEYAAHEALKVGNYDYAAALFREAAQLYEQEGASDNYSSCFIAAKRASARRAWEIFTHARVPGAEIPVGVSFKERFKAFKRWLLNELSYGIWGYGERPEKTLVIALLLVLIYAGIYQISGLVKTSTGIRPIDFGEAIYFSAITFCTVGFGDYLPTGFIRIFAVMEAISGITLPSLFLIALSRRYLRMER